jgi:hypothetical protein
MSVLARQRAAQRQALQSQCARQRATLAARLQDAHRHLEPIDRALAAVRSLRRAPVLVGGIAAVAGLAGTLLAGRARRHTGGRWMRWMVLAGPLLRLLEDLWKARRSAASVPSSSETPGPERP